MIVSVKFFACVWDNHQGCQGKVIEITKNFKLEDETPLHEVHEKVIELIQYGGYNDSFTEKGFSGHGIISINL